MPSPFLTSESFEVAEVIKTEHETPQEREASLRRRAKASGWILLISGALVLASGSWDSLAIKWMNLQKVAPCDGCELRYFEAPFFQTFTVYLGEFLCLPAYWIGKYIASLRKRPKLMEFATSDASFSKQPCPKYWWLLPVMLDFVGTLMVTYSIIFTQASSVGILRNFNIVATAVLSVLYIKVALRRHQIAGVLIVTIGLVITGLYSILHPDASNNYGGMDWLGILLALIGTLMTAIQSIVEEKLFRKYRCSPLEAIGWQGLYGAIIGGTLLIIFQFTGTEKTSETIYMMSQGTKESSILIGASIGFVLSVSIFNSTGLVITKLGSAVLRMVLVAARVVTIWVVELIVKWNTFNGLNFAGLVVLLTGVIIYNYNYMVSRDSWKGDAAIRKPVMIGGARDPDVPIEFGESSAAESSEPQTSKKPKVASMETQPSETQRPVAVDT